MAPQSDENPPVTPQTSPSPEAPAVELRLEGGGTVRVSMIDGTVSGLENVPSSQAINLCLALNKIGESFETVQNYAASARVYDAGSKISRLAGQRLYSALMLNNRGLALKRNGDADNALAAYQEATKALRQPEQSAEADLERRQLLAQTLFNTAVLENDRGNSAKAEESASWGLELVQYEDDSASRTLTGQLRAVCCGRTV